MRVLPACTCFTAARARLFARVFEAGDGVGGTWYWNRYPGARCDSKACNTLLFSEELQQEWNWTERYAGQAEILRYADHVADRFDLQRDIQFDTRVTAALRRGRATLWHVRDRQGATRHRALTDHGGGLPLGRRTCPTSTAARAFEGEIYHTGHWPHEGVDFTGKRVGVIGTGSTASSRSRDRGAGEAPHRVPAHRELLVPATTGRSTPEYQARRKADYRGASRRAAAKHLGSAPTIRSPNRRPRRRRRASARRATRQAGRRAACASAAPSATADRQGGQRHRRRFVSDKIRSDREGPGDRGCCCPNDHLRLPSASLDTDYFETFNRDNVRLVDVRADPDRATITATGIERRRAEYRARRHRLRHRLRRDDRPLLNGSISAGATGDADARNGRTGRAPISACVAGFPNLFTITGPAARRCWPTCPSIEQHVDWIADCIAHMREQAQDGSKRPRTRRRTGSPHVNEVANATLMPRANSWYLGANMPASRASSCPIGPASAAYRRICDEVAAKGYEGFEMT